MSKILQTAAEQILTSRRPSDFLAAWLRNCGLLVPENRRVFAHYYRNFRELRSHRLRRVYDRQLEEIMNLVAATARPRVLEVGSGCGTESLWFSLNGATVTSIDIKQDRLAVARERQSLLEGFVGHKLDCQFERKSLLDVDGNSKYDLIWVQQTFHHLEPRAECVAAIVRLLRPGGAVVMSEVNAWNPLVQLMLLRRRGLKTIVEFSDVDGRRMAYGNERILTASSLGRWFQRFGLSKGTSAYYRLLPSHPVFDRLDLLERCLSGRILKPLYTHYNFVAWKPAEAQP